MIELKGTDRIIVNGILIFFILLFIIIIGYQNRFEIGEEITGIKVLDVTYSMTKVNRFGTPVTKGYKDEFSDDIFYVECKNFNSCSLTRHGANITYVKTTNLFGSIAYKVISENN